MRESSARIPSPDVLEQAGDRSEGGAQQFDALAHLLQRAAQGDQAAWRSLIDLYSRRVFALARSRLKNDHLAEELTQSVFCTVATKLAASGYTEQGKFEPWLFRIAINRIRDHVRSTQRRTPSAGDAPLEHLAAATPSVATTSSDTLDALRLAMESISDADRQVVELRHQAGLSFQQIADIVDEPIGTLLARHHRALRKLKALIEAFGVSIPGSSSPQVQTPSMGQSPQLAPLAPPPRPPRSGVTS